MSDRRPQLPYISQGIIVNRCGAFGRDLNKKLTHP
jgi:hypothetical protein